MRLVSTYPSPSKPNHWCGCGFVVVWQEFVRDPLNEKEKYWAIQWNNICDTTTQAWNSARYVATLAQCCNVGIAYQHCDEHFAELVEKNVKKITTSI